MFKNNIKNVEDICSEVDKSMDKGFIPMAPEIVQTSSFYYPTYESFMDASDDEKNHYVYSRGTNPTTETLEKMLASIEGGEKCKVFSSGMGAISATLFTLLQKGDHLLMVNTVYGETVAFANYLNKYGVSASRIDVNNTQEIINHIEENTKVIYFESPSSQKFELLDLELIASIAKKRKITTVIDGTWASPIFQKPIQSGIDLVIHSMSKYIGGHSDIVGGAVVGSTTLVNQIFEYGHQSLGAVNSPFNSWLTIRSLRTLPIRMSHFSIAVQELLDGLNGDSRIAKLFHPYYGDEEQQRLAKKYLTGYGSLFAIDMTDTDFKKLKTFVDSLKIMSIGVSWGGFESLALPAFKGNNLGNLEERGLSCAHVRMYLGLENPQSILADIKQALYNAYGAE